MYGFDHIPLLQRAIQVDEFIAPTDGSSAVNGFIEYTIPRSATFLYVVLVGGGANGGTPTVGVAAAGGDGGGSGCITKAIIPVFLLPKSIYVRLAATVGGSTASTLSVSPSALAAEFILTAYSGSLATGGSAMTGALARWSGTLALWVSQVGATGGAGSTTNGAAVTALGTLPLTGGGGGGGSSAGTGGNVTGAGPFPTITGGASGENPGRPGYMLRQPFGGVGGSGGGGVNAAGTGLNKGGDGAIGCGGGGGGNASSGTAGAGGKGGPGYCLIVAF